MKKIPLGKTGTEVSEFCLGTMYFGTRTDEDTSYRLLDTYVEAGGSFLDTANIYSRWVPGYQGGESEKLLGRWMKERKNRPSMFVATKVGFEMPGVERGLRAAQIEAECDKSLQRLGIDRIDLYYAHVDDRTTPLEETLRAFDNLIQAGKVRYIGASNYSAWRLAEAEGISEKAGLARYCCVQQRYSYIRPKQGATFLPQLAANDDLLDYCGAKDVTLLAYSPLLGGAYTRLDREFPPQYQGTDTTGRLKILAAVAKESGATLNQVVLAWMRESTPAVIPLVAASSLEQMNENLTALAISLSPDQLVRLNAASA